MAWFKTANHRIFPQRKIPLVAAFVSVTVLIGLTIAPNYAVEAQTLSQHYGITLANGQLLYLLLSLVSIGAFIFAPIIRTLLANPFIGGLVLIFAFLSSFTVVRLTIPDVGFHLGFYPPRLWWIMMGIIVLNCLLVLEISKSSRLSNQWVNRVAIALTLIIGSVLLILYVASVGRYRNIEDFDEPWMANIATNYAQFGTLESNFGGSMGDIFSPRYYLVMGLWLRLVGQSNLVALRAFPTLVGLLTVLLVTIFLFRLSTFNNLQRIIGMVVMLGSLPFLWSSHFLRPEIGLATYGALVLISAYYFFSNSHASRWWLVAMGLALYIGLETIPTYSVSFGVAIGVIVIIHAFRRSLRNLLWAEIGAYLIGAIGALSAYGLIHFWPPSRLTNLSIALQMYSYANTGRFLTPKWLLNGLSLMNAISPIEIIFVIGLIVLMAWRGQGTDRWITAILGGAILTAFFPWSATVGYLALLAPFLAYAAARVSNRRTAAVIATFVLLPALTSMPIADTMDGINKNQNLGFLDQAAQLSDVIPEGSTIVGYDQLWYVLHTNRTYIGWPGVRIAAGVYDLNFVQAVQWYKPDYVICQLDSPECQSLNESDRFALLFKTSIQDQKFEILQPK